VVDWAAVLGGQHAGQVIERNIAGRRMERVPPPKRAAVEGSVPLRLQQIVCSQSSLKLAG
jgi:hypothetical protein